MKKEKEYFLFDGRRTKSPTWAWLNTPLDGCTGESCPLGILLGIVFGLIMSLFTGYADNGGLDFCWPNQSIIWGWIFK
jgi:hypothetical protein